MKKRLGLIGLVMVVAVLMAAFVCRAADVSLIWDQSIESDLSHYNVYRADRIGDKTTEWSLVATDIMQPSYTDTVQDGKNFAWLVTAVDTSGNESFVSNMVELVDKTPPGHLKNLRKQ